MAALYSHLIRIFWGFSNTIWPEAIQKLPRWRSHEPPLGSLTSVMHQDQRAEIENVN